MRLIEIIDQHRNDFTGVLECEFCDKKQLMRNGYDDYNFHSNVIPRIQCVSCGKRTKEDDTPGISDPGTQGAVPIKQADVTVKKWVYE